MRRPEPVLTLSQTGPLIRLLLDGRVQAVVDERGLAEMIPGASSLAGIALAARPEATRALVVGVGLGSDVRRLRARGVSTLAVEIDPRVARLARHFNAGDVVEGDGRAAWKSALARGDRFDLILVDACTGPGAPARHLWTERAARELGALVAPRRGAVLVRILASPAEPLQAEIERALRASFAGVAWHREAIARGVASQIGVFSSPASPRRAQGALVAAGFAIAGCAPTTAPASSTGTGKPIPAESAPAAASASAPSSPPSPPEPEWVEGSCPARPPRPAPPPVASSPDGRPGVRVVGFLHQDGSELILERLSNELVPVRYTLRGAAAEPLRKLARGFQGPEEQARMRAYQGAIARSVGCFWDRYGREIRGRSSPIVVSVEGWSRPRTQRPPPRAAAGFDGELEVTKVRLTRTAAELGPPRAYLGWGCVHRNTEGPLPAEPLADELRREQLEPARALSVFGYLSKSSDGRYFLDAPHHDMGGVRFLLAGKGLDAIPVGPFFTQGDLGDDATDEQMAKTLADLVGGGGVKRSNLRFSSTAVLVRGRARHVISVDPDNMARRERTFRPCPEHPDLPAGGELYEIDLDAIDWSLTRAQYDAFVQREVTPRIAAARAALARRKPAEALSALSAIAAAYAALLPIPPPALVQSGLIQASAGIHEDLARPADRPEHAPLLPLAVLLRATEALQYARVAEARALREAALAYVVGELDRITGDSTIAPAIRARAASGAAAMAEYRDEKDPMIKRLGAISRKSKWEGDPAPLQDLLEKR